MSHSSQVVKLQGKIKSPQYLNGLDHDTYLKERKHGVFTSKNIIQEKMINISKPTIGTEEKEAVLRVLDSGKLAAGGEVKKFEKKFSEYIGTKYAVATSSGTTALHTMISALALKPGDEVITTAFSFIATANAICYCGLKPVFVDIDEKTFNIKPESINDALKRHKRVRAVLLVHLFGLACDMEKIEEICKQNNLFLLEDCAQAHGSTYNGKKVGAFGHLAAFSFYATKNMTTAEGGMITGNNEMLVQKCRRFINHGMLRKYVYSGIGYNFRMNDIEAAIGVCQLDKINEFNTRRVENANLYNKLLNKYSDFISIPYVPQHCGHVYHQYVVQVPQEERDKLVSYLDKQQIQCGIFYPTPLYHYFSGNEKLILNNVEKISKRVLALPVHPKLEEKEIIYIAKQIEKYFE